MLIHGCTLTRMTPHEFIAKWRPVTLSERSACHSHFNDLCLVLGQPQPVAADPDGAWYTFERGVRKTAGGHGWADVWMRGRFGWEYKKRRRNLDEAYQQLLQYREDLENPPLLVVCAARPTSSGRVYCCRKLRLTLAVATFRVQCGLEFKVRTCSIESQFGIFAASHRWRWNCVH